jgi:CubicO group peptidase (beta-lactamase class C family)
MRSSSRHASAIILVVSATAGTAQTKTTPDWTAFDKYVAAAAHDWHVPALAISVVKDDSLVFAKGYGVLQVGKPTRADEHTRFAIGSTTKAMTSAAIAMLVDEGKLHFDDRVSKFIPELQLLDPWATRELTIRDLLTHRTGLPGTDLFWAASWQYSPAEVIRRLRYIQPSASFRSTWQYQNVMYALNGTIIERVSGMPWEKFVKQRIFEPLGMKETEALVADIIGKSNVAVPHALSGDSAIVVPIKSTDPVASAGSVWSSVSDMSKWMRFVLDSGRVGTKRLISQASFRELVIPQIAADQGTYPELSLSKPDFFSYGLGWFIQDYAGQQVWMHTGSINGLCAIIGLMPNEKLGVYVLENLDHAELRHGLMYSVFDLYNGGPKRDWSAEVRALNQKLAAAARPPATTSVATKPSLPLDRYAGTFVDSAYGDVKVTLTDGALQAQIVDQPSIRLEPWEYDTFRSRDGSGATTQVTFVPDGSGNVSAVRIRGITFARVRASRPR